MDENTLASTGDNTDTENTSPVVEKQAPLVGDDESGDSNATPIPADDQTAEASGTDIKPLEEQNQAPEGESLTTLAKQFLPDQEFATDKEAAAAIQAQWDEYRQYHEDNTKANKRLVDIFKSSPELIDLIHLMNKGATFLEALPYITGDAEVDDTFDDAQEEWKKTASQKSKEKAENDKALKETVKNLDISMRNVKEFASENNMTDQDAADFLMTIDEIVSSVSKGNITKAIMSKLHKGLFADRTIKDEAEKAEIRGRNLAIDDIKGRQAKKTGDGLPHPKSSNTDPAVAIDESSPASIISRNISSFADDRRF